MSVAGSTARRCFSYRAELLIQMFWVGNNAFGKKKKLMKEKITSKIACVRSPQQLPFVSTCAPRSFRFHLQTRVLQVQSWK